MNTFIKNNSLLIGSNKQEFLYDPNKLVLVYDTSKEPANNTISFPVNGASPNVTVDWGDNTSDTYTTTGWKTHTYTNPGIYVVQASGVLRALTFGSGGSSSNNRLKLVRCLSFGNVLLTSLLDAFRNCINLIQAPTSLPVTSNITNLGACFAGCTSFNYNIDSWNTSTVLTIANLFNGATIFNQPLNSWNVSNVTTMSNTFGPARAFNQPLSNWNTGSVINMSNMFNGAWSFNQNINTWNVSNVTSMASMFASALSFNQPLNNWNTSSVLSMNNMFGLNRVFNQDLSSWNTSSIQTMSSMFNDSDAFTSNLGSWNLSSLNSSTSLNNFMNSATGMTTTDYDATLIGWNNNKASFRNDLSVNFGGSKYSAAGAAARAALIAYGWNITDGGLAP